MVGHDGAPVSKQRLENGELEHIKESAEKEGRYGKRAKEVAARTVMKHHKEEKHQRGE